MTRRRMGERRRGGAVVELAAVMPNFLFLILGQIESPRWGWSPS